MSDKLIPIPYENTFENASSFLKQILMPSAEEFGSLLQDNIRLWRVKNQIRILNKAREYFISKGIEPKRIPVKNLAPLIEFSSLEEDVSIQDKWALLLAHAADPSLGNNNLSSHIQILNQLSPIEVFLLDQLLTIYDKNPPNDRDKIVLKSEIMSTAFKIQIDDFKIILGNLTRLNLVQSPTYRDGLMVAGYPVVIHTEDIFQLTRFGYDFIKQCKDI